MPGQIPEATMRSPFALTLALVATSGLAAQEGHEQHAEHLGRVRFPVSCNTEAQRRFERGVALLHSFWYEKAGEAFKDAVTADSTCAMGYWGQAMALLHPLWTPPTPSSGLASRRRTRGLLSPGRRASPHRGGPPGHGRGGHRGRDPETPGDPGRRAPRARAARRLAARAQPASRRGAGLRSVTAPGAGPGAQSLRARAGRGTGGRHYDGARQVPGVSGPDGPGGR